MDYILPTSTQGMPGGLNLIGFIQTVLIGVSGLDGKFVRPKWQVEPLISPGLAVDWIAFAIVNSLPNANGYVGTPDDNSTIYSRQETLEIQCSFYGPKCYEIMAEVRDGFQIPQNIESLQKAKMGFTSVSNAVHSPELYNGRYVDRYEMSIFLQKQTLRTYAIQSFVSAKGTIHTVLGNEEYLLGWDSENARDEE